MRLLLAALALLAGIGSAHAQAPVLLQSIYPYNALPVTASTVGTTGATTATLPASVFARTWICGFTILANATAATTGNATVTGTIGGTMNFTQFTAPLASGIGAITQQFLPCVPSSSANQAIAVNSAAAGAGGTISVTAWGFQQ